MNPVEIEEAVSALASEPFDAAEFPYKFLLAFGNPETTSGGRALKFYSSVRVEVRRGAAIKDGDAITGNRTKVKVVKNKVAAPFKEAEVDLIHGEGISRESDLIDLGTAHNVIEKSGSWFSYAGERIGQGRENARQYLKEHADTAAQIDCAIRGHDDRRRPVQWHLVDPECGKN